MTLVRAMICCGLTAFAILPAASAKARDIGVHQAAVPILYRYAACVFAQDEPTAEGQVAFCSLNREEAEQSARDVLRKYHFGSRSPAERDLTDELDQLDEEAVIARRERKFVPAAIVNYLQCMGDGVMQSEDYQAGVAVSYLGVEDSCVTEHVLSVTTVQTEQELERIQLLYGRFSITGRYVDRNPNLGQGIRSTGDRANVRRLSRPLSRAQLPLAFVNWQNGFLGLHRLPADEVAND